MEEDQMKSVPVKSSEITPEHIFLNRRQFLKAMGITGAAAVLAACSMDGEVASTATAPAAAAPDAGEPLPENLTDELGDAANSYEEITNYNNYYEFTVVKQDVAPMSKDFPLSPWTVEVGGLVNNPRTFGIEDILKLFPQEERIYRLRCVEAWSMVIPWEGFPLSALLKEVEPQSNARFVAFQTVNNPDKMPGQRAKFYPWPYDEGLRLDEAMNDLTILATGMYGKPLLMQNGAPIRLVVPWKYGFKSIKSIVKIDLVADEPKTFWSNIAPDEYGFYANVNPEVSHPRWSQATERRIGETARRKTLMFNGYAEEVAAMYADMDLRVYY
ncbi:MAG TPA: protein-methionine-sulfoxide reductase catalytic subunit MsrP [Anaerolineaceae bacterium]